MKMLKGNAYKAKAFAKINLTLDITGILENGYHSIASVMQTISLYDEISVEKNDSGEIRLFSGGGKFAEGMPLDEKNTCHKAAKVFLEHMEISEGVDIHIKKNIPSQAGLGGGSSDAATVLRLLNRLFETDFSFDELRELAVKIGADVPFLVTGGCALCEGVGEVLTPIDNGLTGYVLLKKPDFGISTPEAYRLFDEKKLPFGHSSKAVIDSGSFHGLLSNDLEKAVANPEILELKEELVRLGASDSLMTGSGSCVYGLFEYRRVAEHVGRLIKEYPTIGVYEPVSSEEVTVL
ncbi:MAG: 4-(cytidine 5'-diphospho)-2-C-methyl-D-erythritol kinase [Oscillospiraceae bacterium]|nr:4-(cytidine 5'-diphospho)-2-C-methyl-D-erythritol kinase [Oscillospiraceae bacterium]